MGCIRGQCPGNSEPVYSTVGGRVERGGPTPVASSAGSTDCVVRVSPARAGRKGETVSLVTGIPPGELTDICKELKRLSGSAGSVTDGMVERERDPRLWKPVLSQLRDTREPLHRERTTYMRSGASTPMRSRPIAITVRVARSRSSRKATISGASPTTRHRW